MVCLGQLKNLKILITMREDIAKIKRAVECACSSNTAILRANWNTIAGNNTTYTYYSGIVPGNPSGSTSNVETAEYFDYTGLVFTQTFTYDANDNVLTITTT